jgi:sirohydrochlorin cobaltochelatase
MNTSTSSSTNATTPRGIILFAHGSRDPLWRLPMEAVAERVKQLDATATVACAFLELTEPSLPTCAADMIAAGVQSITIVPLFLGVGKHAREDLPLLITELKAAHPSITITQQVAIGEDERVLDLLAHVAVES